MSVAVAAIVIADLLVIGFCVVYLSRAARTLSHRWQEQRIALETVRGSLERLVGDADARAQEFERLLASREKQLRTLLYQLAEEEERLRGSAPARPGGDLERGVRRLQERGLGPMEVARELDADPAQVRLLFELGRDAGRKAEA
jgi:hypothetical protein